MIISIAPEIVLQVECPIILKLHPYFAGFTLSSFYTLNRYVYKITYNTYVNDQHKELSRLSHVRLFVCLFLYTRNSPSFFEISIRNFAHALFERSKSSVCMENFFSWRDISKKFGMRYCLKQWCNLRENCSDQITAIQTDPSKSSSSKAFFVFMKGIIASVQPK